MNEDERGGQRPGRSRAPRHPPKLWRVPVSRTELVTPRMVRVTVGGEMLADFPDTGGEAHVVLYFYPEGVEPPQPLTLESARVGFAAARPQMRSYTVRRHDRARREIDLDFVLHDEHGPASEWARQAGPGDSVIVVGPSPGYRPDPSVGGHVFVGDETALPAIGAMLAELPSSVRALVVIEVADAAEEQPLPSAADTEIVWLHRAGKAPGASDLLVDALRSVDLPPDEVAVWAAGERTAMRVLRDHLLGERKLDRRRVRPTSYWHRGHAGSVR